MSQVGNSIVPLAVFEVRTVRHLPAVPVARLQLLPAPLAPFKIAQMSFQLRHDINESGHKVGSRSIVVGVVGLERSLDAHSVRARARTSGSGDDTLTSTRRPAVPVSVEATAGSIDSSGRQRFGAAREPDAPGDALE